MRPADVAEVIDNPRARGEISAFEVTQAFITRIEDLNPKLNAFITVLAKDAIAKARAADRRRRRRRLEGVVVAVKDNIAVGGAPMTAGSRIYRQHRPARDAAVVEHLTGLGAIVIGKTHLHELAMGSTGDNPFFGRCRNPWDIRRSPGGSSGGSAVAVAADLCMGALGTDTGGSIRNPAAICGVTGLRPTVGVVSNRGVVPVAPSFDTVGPIARSAADVRELFNAIAGLGSGPERIEPPRHLRVGLLACDYFYDDLSEPVRNALDQTAKHFAELGIGVVQLDPGDVQGAEADFFQLLKSESAKSHNHELDSSPDDFSAPLRRMLLEARSLPRSAVEKTLLRAAQWRRRVIGDLFAQCEVLLTPLQLDEPLDFDDPALNAGLGRAMRYTFPWSLARLPAIALPCGAFPDGMPIGCQLVGKPHSDGMLLDLAVRFQASTAWHLRRPTLSVP